VEQRRETSNSGDHEVKGQAHAALK